MPALYPLPRQLVYTPPDVYGSSPNEYCYPANSAAYGYNGSDARRAWELQDSYNGYAKQNMAMRESAIDHIPSAMAGFSSALDRRERIPSQMPAPILPPIRIPDTVVNAAAAQDLSNSRAVAPAEKNAGKTTGGVAAQLDYEMEDMVDFVSEAAQGMYDLLKSHPYLADIDLSRSVQPGSAISVAFRKYVSSILSSTRLPSSTVVLALHYLATRVTLISTHNGGADVSASTTQLHRMITTALMLASKFLDDNTFQNRSWADVSHISVHELNLLELNWLAGVGWSLHIDTARDPAGFGAWRARWDRFQTRREGERKERAALSMDALRLTPPDPFPVRARQFGYLPPPTPATPAYTPYGPDPLSAASSGWSVVDRPSPPWNQWPRAPRDTPPASAAAGWSQWPPAARRDQVSPTWSDWASSRRLTPPSAGTSGPATPEWYGRPGPGAFGARAAAHYARPLPPPASHGPAPHGAFDAQYGPYHAPAWGGHAMGCGCGYCVQPDRYAMGHGYAVQPVMG